MNAAGVTFESNGTPLDLPTLLERVDARPYAGGWIGHCPAHGDRCPSLSIKAVEGRILLHCFADCPYEAIIDALGGRPWRRIFGLPSAPAVTTLDDRKRTEIARRIWRAACPASGTLVEDYFRARGISLAPLASVRFDPSLRHPSGTYLPAMVAAVQGADGKIVGVHRTYLRSDGSGKANIEPQKAMLGPCAGGAVRFSKPAAVLGVGEGIETMLAIAQACPSLGVWAALSTSGLKTIQLPDPVEEIVVFADGDAAGERAAECLVERVQREGRRARIVRAPAGRDFNDVLKQGPVA